MSAYSEARKHYRALSGNAQAMAQVRAEFAALSLSRLTDPNGSASVTSGTMNGQTLTMSHDTTPAQRFEVLSLICAFDDAGGQLPSQTTAVFY